MLNSVAGNWPNGSTASHWLSSKNPGPGCYSVAHLDRLGRHDEAEECLRKALEVDPDYDEAHYNLGYNYKKEGKFALAEKHLRRAIEIDPKYAQAYAELGALLLRGEE